MGDVSEVLSIILSPGGFYKYSLNSTGVIEVPKDTLTYTNDDKLIMRQYEGSMMSSYKYSIFVQEKGITFHHHMFEIHYTVQQM